MRNALYGLTYLPAYGPAVIRVPLAPPPAAYHRTTIGFGAELADDDDDDPRADYATHAIGFVADRLN